MSQQSDSNSALAGKVAIVTGGASGIGRATCATLARLGALVVVADLHADNVANAVRDLVASSPDNRAMGIVCNVTREEEVTSMIDQTITQFGQLDILVHSAGVLRAKNSAPMPLAQLSTEEFDFVVGTNLKGTFLCNRAALSPMFKQRSGQIVNVASTSGRKGRPLDSAYCASKFGVVGLTESLAEEVRPFGIRVHLVLPDAVQTPLWEQNGPVPAPEWSLPPERVAETIGYLLCLPPDTSLGEVAVFPVRTRRRSARKTSPTENATAVTAPAEVEG